MPLSLDDLISLNKDISETINYARHRMGADWSKKEIHDIWENIERTNQNLQMLLNDIINQKLGK